jgi:hypothetical protein
MNATTLLGIGAPACLLFSGSVVLFFRGKTVPSFLQLLGAGCLLVVVLAHVSEALHLFPWMQWGLPQSVGHYVDFWSAVLGLALFPIGYFSHALTIRRAAFVSIRRRTGNGPMTACSLGSGSNGGTRRSGRRGRR